MPIVNNKQVNPVEIVECDNCGEHKAVFRDDPFTDKVIHGVCTTCGLPMTVNNPWYGEK